MSDTTFTISVSYPAFRKWDIIRTASNGDEGIIIRVKANKVNISNTIYPYEKQDTKFAQWVWFKLLKLLVLIRLI